MQKPQVKIYFSFVYKQQSSRNKHLHLNDKYPMSVKADFTKNTFKVYFIYFIGKAVKFCVYV